MGSWSRCRRAAGDLGTKLDALLDEHRFASRTRLRLSVGSCALTSPARLRRSDSLRSVRRSVEGFDQLVAFASLLPTRISRSRFSCCAGDHAAPARPLTLRRRTRDPGGGGLSRCSTGSNSAARNDLLGVLRTVPREPRRPPIGGLILQARRLVQGVTAARRRCVFYGQCRGDSRM